MRGNMDGTRLALLRGSVCRPCRPSIALLPRRSPPRAAASAGGPSTPHHSSRRVRLVPEPRPEIVPLPDHLADELLVPIILLAVPRERRRGDARDADHAIRQLSCPPTRQREERTQQKEEELAKKWLRARHTEALS